MPGRDRLFLYQTQLNRINVHWNIRCTKLDECEGAKYQVRRARPRPR